MENGKKKKGPIDGVRQEGAKAKMDNLTEADVKKIVRQEIESCKIEDLHKRVKHLEECGGPSGR